MIRDGFVRTWVDFIPRYAFDVQLRPNLRAMLARQDFNEANTDMTLVVVRYRQPNAKNRSFVNS